MRSCFRLVLVATCAAAALASFGTSAQQQPAGSVVTPGGEPARPRNPTANLPSDSGSQTTTPAGAATGAGQPQGMTRQPDVGSPGGLERRARMRERAAGASAASRTGADTVGGDSATAGERERQPRQRARRASKG